MLELIVLAGLPGSGKSTYCKEKLPNHVRISQDDMGKKEHYLQFKKLLEEKCPQIVIDRVNFNPEQRSRYLKPAKEAGYTTKIIVLRQNILACRHQIANRIGHPTLTKENDVPKILDMFKGLWQDPAKTEANIIEYVKQPYYAKISDFTHISGKVLVFGDLHGVWEEFIKVVEQEKPEYIFSVGDLNDRGPDYLKLLDFFMDPKNNAFQVMGNHEKKLLHTLIKGKVTGLSKELQDTVDQLPKERIAQIINYLETLPHIIKLPRSIIVHAGIDFNHSLEKQRVEDCIYMRHFGGTSYQDVNAPMWYEVPRTNYWQDKQILHGHIVSEQLNNQHKVLSLDAGAVYGRGLRYLKVEYQQLEGVEVLEASQVLSVPTKEYAEDEWKQAK